MGNLEVSLLGKFEITHNGVDILATLRNSKKKISLLQYLLINKDMQFANSNLFEHLWGDDNSTNPESALKTLVSRLRKDLKAYDLSDIISTSHGVYQWNAEKYGNIDIYKFDELAAELLSVDELTDEIVQKFENIFALYRGDLLAGYNNESWLVSRSMHYHQLYLSVVYRYINLLNEDKRYNEVLSTARRALEIDKYDSRLNLELMTAMLSLGIKAEALNYYNYLGNLYHTQLGTSPSQDILDFYKTLMAVEHSSDDTLSIVARELEADDGDNTAFICDYAIFKDIYKINMRNLQRLGITMFLVVFTLSSTSSEPSESEMILLDKVMSMLQATLKFNLRKGDTIARYGASQFVVLLPTQNRDLGSVAFERVKNAFYKTCSITSFVLSYRLTPIGFGIDNNQPK